MRLIPVDRDKDIYLDPDGNKVNGSGKPIGEDNAIPEREAAPIPMEESS